MRISSSPAKPHKPGKPQRRESRDQHGARPDAAGDPEPAQAAQRTGLFTRLNLADREEQHRAEEPVRDHVDQRAAQRERLDAAVRDECEDAQQDQP